MPARVQSMPLTTFNEQANLEQRPNLSPNDLAKKEESYYSVTGFISYKPQSNLLTPRACASPKSRPSLSSVPDNQSSHDPDNSLITKAFESKPSHQSEPQTS